MSANPHARRLAGRLLYGSAMWKRAMLAIVLCGCGVEPAPYPSAADLHGVAAHSGTRLKLEWWESVDGTSVLRGIYDRDLDASCAIQKTAAEDYYCVPAQPGAPLWAYARLTHESEAVDAPIVPTWFASSDGLVLPDGFVDVSGESPPVALEFERDGGRLLPGYFVTANELRMRAPSLYDRELGVTCQPADDGPATRCVPASDTGGAWDASELALLVPSVDP